VGDRSGHADTVANERENGISKYGTMKTCHPNLFFILVEDG
jgi:hypothetical protein